MADLLPTFLATPDARTVQRHERSKDARYFFAKCFELSAHGLRLMMQKGGNEGDFIHL